MTDPVLTQFVGVLAACVGACGLTLIIARAASAKRAAGATLQFSPLWAVAGTLALIDAAAWILTDGVAPTVLTACGVLSMVFAAQASLIMGTETSRSVSLATQKSAADSAPASARRAA